MNLEGLLTRLRLRSTLSGRVSLSGAWAASTGAVDGAVVYLPIAGTMFVHDDRHEPAMLGAGDALMFPMGPRHIVSSTQDFVDPQPIASLLRRRGARLFQTLEITGEPADVEPVQFLAVLAHWSPGAEPLAEQFLPERLVVRDVWRMPGLGDILTAMRWEMEQAKALSPAVLLFLVNAAMIALLREEIEANASVRRNLTRQDGAKRALSELSELREQRATTGELAARTGQSRRSFTRSFERLAGCTPAAFARGARLNEAAQLLRQGGVGVALAGRVAGYESRPSFVRAFKKHFGVSPREWRSVAQED